MTKRKVECGLYFGICGMILSPLFSHFFLAGLATTYTHAAFSLGGLLSGFLIGSLLSAFFGDSYKKSISGGIRIGFLAGPLTAFISMIGIELYGKFQGGHNSFTQIFEIAAILALFGGFFLSLPGTPIIILFALLLTKILKIQDPIQKIV